MRSHTCDGLPAIASQFDGLNPFTNKSDLKVKKLLKNDIQNVPQSCFLRFLPFCPLPGQVVHHGGDSPLVSDLKELKDRRIAQHY